MPILFALLSFVGFFPFMACSADPWGWRLSVMMGICAMIGVMKSIRTVGLMGGRRRLPGAGRLWRRSAKAGLPSGQVAMDLVAHRVAPIL